MLIVYEGQELLPRNRYFYRVKVWDQSGLQSPWSEIAFWEMGQLSSADWTAKWITPDAATIDPNADEAFYLRKTFTARKGIRKATIYATSLRHL